VRIPESFESEHRVRSGLDVSMILFDHVIQILRGAHMRLLRQQSVSDQLAHGPVRGGIPIERDRLRWLALMFDDLGRPPQEVPLGDHPDRIAQAELVAKVPAHTRNNDFPIEMPAIKQPLQSLPLAHRPSPD
jgi:hypothetical protein